MTEVVRVIGFDIVVLSCFFGGAWVMGGREDHMARAIHRRESFMTSID